MLHFLRCNNKMTLLLYMNVLEARPQKDTSHALAGLEGLTARGEWECHLPGQQMQECAVAQHI